MFLTTVIILFLLFAHAQAQHLPMVDIRAEVDYGFDTIPEHRRQIDIIVVHSNYHAEGRTPFSTKGCLDQFKQYDVAPHYMITRDGQVLQMVDERFIAWHCGPSRLPGTDRDSLNFYSIGIELVSTPRYPPTELQTERLVELVKDIRSRHDIQYLMRHSDIAPERKTDPWNFPWGSFARRVEESSGEIIWVE